MEKCDCYHERTRKRHIYGGALCVDETYGVCYGTRECDECNCGGDPAKCDFYESIRKKANGTMNTAEMWIKAQEDGKTYQTNDLFYNKKHGFVDSNFKPWPINCVSFIDDVFSWVDWHESEIPYMTKAEAEKEFGIKIVD